MQTSALLFLIADVVCKNSYGIVLWSTTWGVLVSETSCLPLSFHRHSVMV